MKCKCTTTYLLNVFTATLLCSIAVYAAETDDNKSDTDKTTATTDPGANKADEQQRAKDFKVPKIYLAAKEGKLRALKSLIADGEDVNASNSNGRTALMTSILYKNKKISTHKILVDWTHALRGLAAKCTPT